jgi:hypothetical protein
VALVSEILHPRVSDFLRRHFALRGGLRTQVAPDVQPIIDVEAQYRERIDLASEQGWSGFYGRTILAAGGAGQFGNVGLGNPATAGVVAFGWLLRAAKNAVENMGFGVIPSPFGALAALSTTRVDPRSALQPNNQLQLATNTLGAATKVAPVVPAGPVSPANPQLWLPFVLSPGFVVMVLDQTANEQIEAYWLWFERPLVTPNE